MAEKVDLYDNAYGNYASDAYRQVRVETYGQDFGQTSWVTTEESHEIPQLLGLTRDSSVLEIGCGSGGYALHLAETIGCHIVGLDINAAGVRNANQLAGDKRPRIPGALRAVRRFQNLPFADKTFDAVFSNDVLCHVPGRPAVLGEIFRVLKPGARMLFSDALIVGGLISHEEIATRSSIGYYVFSPPGENERLLDLAGFRQIRVVDTTGSAARIAQRWHDAREKRKEALAAAEGVANFEGLQRFLACVQLLTSEKRLLRHLYVATKEPGTI